MCVPAKNSLGEGGAARRGAEIAAPLPKLKQHLEMAQGLK
jgi:hypothetical protein